MSNVRQKKTVRHHRFDRQNIRIPMIKIKKEPPEGETSESSANIRVSFNFYHLSILQTYKMWIHKKIN